MITNFRYKIYNRLGVIQTAPLGESDFRTEYEQKTDGNRDYTKSMPNSIIFEGAAWTNLWKLERSIYRCEPMTLTVERRCTSEGVETWVPEFTGRIRLNDGKWDNVACRVEISLDDINPGQCYEDYRDKEIDLFKKIPVIDRKAVRFYPPNITLEKRDYSTTSPTILCPSIAWNEPGDPVELQWVVYYNKLRRAFPSVPGGCTRQMKWARWVMLVDCDDPEPAPEWVLIESNCPGGQKKYAKPANLYDQTFTPSSADDDPDFTTTIYEWKIVGDSTEPLVLDNGMSLRDVFNVFINEFCTGLVLKSDFFQWNPDIPSDTNYVTNSRSKVREIFVFQKSDAKRPGAGNATKAEWTWEGVLNATLEMFNLEWYIENGAFRIEHVKYRQRNAGLNLLLPQYEQFVKNKTRYSYNNNEIPERDKFTFMEASTGDFAGVPIIYTTCLSKDSRENARENNVDDVTTDVEMMLANPESDSEYVQDEGFAFIATEEVDGVRSIITENGILSPSKVNNSLAWAQLHRDYYKYARPVGKGIMNNEETTFFSTVPTKKGEPITIPFCCGDVFNPDDTILTPLGVGIVETGSFSFRGGTLTLSLLYNAEDGLIENMAPQAVNDVFNIPQDIEAILDILANDIESDQGGSFTEIDITLQPIHGAVEITPDLKVKYTPAPGFIGNDTFVYLVRDDWAEASNEALVSVTIFQQDGPPVAVDDSYQVYQGQTLNVAAPGVLGNDGSNNGKYLSTYQNMSAHGGSVVMQNDGSFAYTPEPSFVGADTFTYTIINDLNLTDTATVTIQVVAQNKPIAVDDEYNASSNNTLTIAAPGLLANDQTAVGVLQVVAEGKPTAEGGSVVINADGSFIYNRPPGIFGGEDSFTYTITNGVLTDVGAVTINVLPRIFAKIVVPDNEATTQIIVKTCSGVPKNTGSKIFNNVYVKFYQDSAGTTPLDVTVYNLTVNFRLRHTDVGGVDDFTDHSVIATPAPGSYELYHQLQVKEYDSQCNGVRTTMASWVVTLLPGNYTII